MPRYKLTIEYDGTPFVGWQMQENGASVQGRLTEAIKSFSGENVIPRGAGRTDAGVHALGPGGPLRPRRGVADRTLCATPSTAQLKPDPISVLDCETVAPISTPASARKRATISTASSTAAARLRSSGTAPGACRALDAKAMDEAAQALVGQHDFTTFRSTECQAESPEKTLDRLAVSRHGEIIRVEASARSFLHNQVRSMVGSLKLVGEGKWTASDLGEALAAYDRAALRPGRPRPRALSGEGRLLELLLPF